jgi:hypothetical protein
MCARVVSCPSSAKFWVPRIFFGTFESSSIWFTCLLPSLEDGSLKTGDGSIPELTDAVNGDDKVEV